MLPLALVIAVGAVAVAAEAAAAGEPDSVTFGEPSSRVGDIVRQSVQVGLSLESKLRRGAEVLEEENRRVERAQRRTVTATALDSGRVTAAQVVFAESHAQIVDGPKAGARDDDPVVGKTYLCWREGDELRVTLPDGKLPPLDEYAVVARAMRTLGTPSPLAAHLAGRTVRVGEKLELPSAVAQQALGFDKEMGEVVDFELELKAIDEAGGARLARFDARIEAVGAGAEQMRLFIAGRFVLDEAQCRVTSADLSGPIAMSSLRGPSSQGYQMDARGKMRLRVAAEHTDAPR
ncbi:hypothetical protein [Botrimarina sp.]|uniref:hypothetical protein n=1 Tax=Botrimarina sp. TaxID=2795802 RepID=UPI0032EBFA4B